MPPTKRQPNAVAIQRLKDLRDREGLYQKELADKLGISEQSVRGYERGATAISEDVARRLEEHFGCPYPFWLGESNAHSWGEYEREYQAIYGEIDDWGDDPELEMEIKIRKAETERKKTFFDVCGYAYENIEDTGTYDFVPLAPPNNPFYKISGPHKLTPYQRPNESVYFSTSEITQLIAQFQNLIDYACYKKSRKEVGDNGTDCQADK